MKFSEELQNWCDKVIRTYNNALAANTDYSTIKVSVDTYQMIKDVDKIIAEGFDHSPVLEGAE